MTGLPWPEGLPAEPSHVDQSLPLRTWYRSLRGEVLWCESSDPEEVVRMSRPGDVFQVLRYHAVTPGWKPWDPAAEALAELARLDSSPESALGLLTGLSPSEIEDLGGLPPQG